MTENNEQFSSRWGILMAAIGMAVGTGNIWRFPRVAAENGGGAFLIARRPRHWSHVSEPPMMCRNAEFHCTLKRDVGMMARLVRAMDQWRPLLCSPRRFAVTLKAVLGEQAIAGSVLSRCRRRRR